MAASVTQKVTEATVQVNFNFSFKYLEGALTHFLIIDFKISMLKFQLLPRLKENFGRVPV